ncbi:MAG: HEPN domain-containing protein [Pirellulales bacterium]
MTRDEFQILAGERIRDAEALINAGRWSGAYYLSGYAVEFALKACIAKLTREHDFPDAKFAQKVFTHDNEALLRAAGLDNDRDAAAQTDSAFADNWLLLKDWNEAARYREWSESQARNLYRAVIDASNGILPWITRRW